MTPTPSAAQINFLRQQRREVETQTTRDKKIARLTVIALSGFLVVVVGIIATRIYFTVQRNAVSTEADAAKTRILTFASLEKEYVLFARKMQLMYNLDKQREAKRQAVKFFYELIPQEDVIQQVQLDTKQSKITFQVESPDVFRMLALLRVFRERITGDVVFNLQVENINRKSDATYTVSGSLAYDALGTTTKVGGK
ncbi:MAG TPA: hypothetical protein VJ246_03740 [Patescibacteria group bacterium]|nr:hypothetical protein [Patescibacteria group bacterium]